MEEHFAVETDKDKTFLSKMVAEIPRMARRMLSLSTITQHTLTAKICKGK